jgi:hypothetical protein
MRTYILAFALLSAFLGTGAGAPVAGQETHLLVVVGLGGDPSYRDRFHEWAVEMITAAEDRLGLSPDRITYLGERPAEAPGVIDDRSTAENLASTLARIGGGAGSRDRILILLIGHGTGDGDDVEFNLPGPDLTPGALNVMLSDFPTQTVAVVNTSPSSGPFVAALSGPNRVILTATRTAQEKNETQFGGFFVQALSEEASDLNKDGRISLLEAFQYAHREVERYYESQNLLATEHALLDDNGDGEGSTELGDEVADGRLAASFWLGGGVAAGVRAEVSDSIIDPDLLRLYQEKAELEARVLELRRLRGQMEESAYELELEALLVEIALKTREIRAKGGGGE